MKKIITILFFLILNIGTYGVTYSSTHKGNVTGYYATYPATFTQSCQYEFKSTSLYAPMTSYQTVKPVSNDGFVSSEYTTYNNQIHKERRGGLGGIDGPGTGGMVPIGEPIVPFLILILAYLSYKKMRLNASFLFFTYLNFQTHLHFGPYYLVHQPRLIQYLDMA